ncbi:HPr family phosphocarrier protein [Deferribacter thermophilus]|uniref:HPr family phosphocarrier protein n=1 Tax=Deferribacter thermophilus TaxID=53573 RepID=UPI003C21E3AB
MAGKKEIEVEIVNELGMHARAAAAFVKEAGKYISDVFIEKDGMEVNGKSIMGILMLAAPKGSKIKIKAIGDDADDALNALSSLVKNKFGEDK